MKKVLLIDDEAHVVSVIRHFLIKSGYEVEIANNGLKGLEVVKQSMPDVIVSDIQMPKMTGQQFCERLRNDYPDNDIMVIIMTSRTERDFRRWAAKMKNVEFLEKPLSPTKLVQRLDEYFEVEECVI